MKHSEWIRRADDSIDLEAQFEREYYPPSNKQKVYLHTIETMQPILNKGLAAMIIVNAHMIYSEDLDIRIFDSRQVSLFNILTN